MKKSIASGFAVMGVAAAIIVPLSYGAQGRETRAERSASTISQSTDRAEARIAILKADLRLSADQAQHWAGLESALNDIAAKRAKRWAASNDLQTGRASSNAPVAPDTSITEYEQRRDTDSQRYAGKARLDDIDEMRRLRPVGPLAIQVRLLVRAPCEMQRELVLMMREHVDRECGPRGECRHGAAGVCQAPQ